MDSLTHIALGACIGELFLGKKIGQRAMLYGAIAASLPDIDFIAGFFLNAADNLLAHRGFTHSILFALIMSLFLGWFFGRKHLVSNTSKTEWFVFIAVEMLVHLFLDMFNAYGVGLFEPFSHLRISLNTIFVADPLFSILPGLAAIILLMKKRTGKRRHLYAKIGMAGSIFYLTICCINKFQTDSILQLNLDRQHISYTRYFSTPTQFNSLLWYIVVENETGFLIGYHSVLDKSDQIQFHYTPRRMDLLDPYKNRSDLKELVQFSKNYYTASILSEGIVFNDLRFGQINGWSDPESNFVFHYYMEHPDDNQLVLQRGRFSNWNFNTFKEFIRKIKGE